MAIYKIVNNETNEIDNIILLEDPSDFNPGENFSIFEISESFEWERFELSNEAVPYAGGFVGSFYGNLQGSSSYAITSSYSLTASYIEDGLDHLTFDTTTLTPASEATLVWNPDDGTLDLGLLGGETVLPIGQQQSYFVKNMSGTTINAGQLVMFSGSLGNSGVLTVQLCNQSNLPSSVYVMGVASTTMNNGDDGYVINFGKIKGINASGIPVGETWNDGDILYVHPTVPGAFTNQMPPDGKWKLIVAAVIQADVNGTVFIRITPANNIGELDNVKDYLSSDGDLFSKSGSIWINTKNLHGNYSIDGNLTVTSGSIDGILKNLKSGVVDAPSAYTDPTTGNKFWDIEFINPYENSNYSVNITSAEDLRIWTVENKQSTGFIINSNSNSALNGEVYWVAVPYNS